MRAFAQPRSSAQGPVASTVASQLPLTANLAPSSSLSSQPLEAATRDVTEAEPGLGQDFSRVPAYALATTGESALVPALGPGTITNSTYQEELQVIRYAVGARELRRLAEGTVLYQARGWQAAGMADGAFYAGPFTSDMGSFYYVYRFTGSDPKTSTYTLSRGSYLLRPGIKDLQAELMQVKGGEALSVATTGLIPPAGGAVAKPSGRVPEGGGQRQPGGEGAGKAEPTQAATEEPEELTPHRKRWMNAGRSSMKDQINGLFGEIQKLKKTRIETWEKNAHIKDPKPIREALEVAVEVVGYGMGGVVGGLLTKAMAHGLAQEFAKEAALKSTVKLAEAIFAHAVEPTEEFMAEATKNALREDKTGNAEKALVTKSSLLDCYVEAETLQSVSEEHAEREAFNATADARFPTDVALADEVAVVDALYKQLFARPESFMRQLSEGLIRLKDEVFLEERAKKYGGDIKRLLERDPTIHETEPRSGNLLLLPSEYSIGEWSHPRLDFDEFHALASEVNTATLMELKGAAVKDLPLTLTFRFWASNPFKGFFVEPLCKVWFERRSDGRVWVDFEESGPGPSVEDGLEWLASYAQGTDREFSKEERRKYAPEGARRLYEQIKSKPVKNLENIDIF
jgi:hypothetical protein